MDGGTLLRESEGLCCEGKRKEATNLSSLRPDLPWVAVHRGLRPSAVGADQRDWPLLNVEIRLLQHAEDELKQFPVLGDRSMLLTIEENLNGRLRSLREETVKDLSDLKLFALRLIDLGKIYSTVQLVRETARLNIESAVNACYEASLSNVFKLGLILRDESTFGDIEDERERSASASVAKELVNDFKRFKDVHTISWNRAAQLGPTSCLDGLKSYRYDRGKTGRFKEFEGDDELSMKNELKRIYGEYKKEYDKNQRRCLENMGELSTLVEETKEIAEKIKSKFGSRIENWSQVNKIEVAKLLAGVFAYFTVSKSGMSYNKITPLETANAAFRREDILIVPHHIQVMSILKLIGCDSLELEALKSQLMEIRTGEGKSILLGGLATILAMLGFEVSTVCYSQYLSFRDYSDFLEIFQAFNCADNVCYRKITDHA